MTDSEAIEAVYETWRTSAPAVALGDARYLFDDEDYEGPPGVVWARVAIRSISNEQLTMGRPGARQYRQVASMFVQLYGPRNGGREAITTVATSVQTAFRGVRVGEIVFFTPKAPRVVRDASWYSIVVECPFDYHLTA